MKSGLMAQGHSVSLLELCRGAVRQKQRQVHLKISHEAFCLFQFLFLETIIENLLYMQIHCI